jgi:predicted nucleic acid-binding protein
VRTVAFLDASVLYSATLRSVLMYLATEELYRPLWSEAVSREWMAALARRRPDLREAAIAKTNALMEGHVDNALVTGYEGLIESLTLPDPDDRHVLATAIHGGAAAIVTLNLKHFPDNVLAPHNVLARHPDDFIMSIFETDPMAVVRALALDRARLRKPPMTVTEYVASLFRAGLPETAAAIRMFADRL